MFNNYCNYTNHGKDYRKISFASNNFPCEINYYLISLFIVTLLLLFYYIFTIPNDTDYIYTKYYMGTPSIYIPNIFIPTFALTCVMSLIYKINKKQISFLNVLKTLVLSLALTVIGGIIIYEISHSYLCDQLAFFVADIICFIAIPTVLLIDEYISRRKEKSQRTIV